MDSDDERNDFFGNDDFDDGPAIGDDEAIEVPSDEAVLKKALEGSEKAPRKRIIQNPQPKLNEMTLTGPKGIAALVDTMKTFKYDKKLDPYANLDIMMKKYENWSHVMFPRLKFDDILARCEKLGSTRSVKAYMGRLRAGESTDDMDEEELVSKSKKNVILTTENNEDDREDDLPTTKTGKKALAASQQFINANIGVITRRDSDDDDSDEVIVKKTAPIVAGPDEDDFMASYDPDEDAMRQFEQEADAMMADFDY